MSLLRRTRTEMAGAWRSLRYDFGRRPAEPSAAGPDMTSTGMNTFGWVEGARPRTTPATHRPPRRAAAVTALGVLTVGGAAGAYLAVVNGLGSLLAETPAAADTFPPAPPAAAAGAGAAPETSEPAAPRRTKARIVQDAPPPAADRTSGSRPTPSPVTATRLVPVPIVKPTNTKDDFGGHPPVPTPTAPEAPTTTNPPVTPPGEEPSATEEPTTAPGESSPGSAEPSETDDSGEPRRHRRHR